MSEPRRVRLDKKGNRVGPAGDGLEIPAAAASDCKCPRLGRDDWHDVESDWSDIAFIETNITAVLGVPMGYANEKAALEGKAEKLGLTVPEDPMVLLGAGRFRRTLRLEVDGAKRGVKGVSFPGGFVYTRLEEVPWGEMQKAVDEMKDVATRKYGKAPHEILAWYLTCRSCSHERNFETLLIAHYRE